MRHKKFTTIVLVIAMTLSLTACNVLKMLSDEVATDNTEASKESSTSRDTADSQTEDKKDDVKENVKKDVKLEAFKTDATIEETILYDENDLKITATDLTYSSYAVELNLLIENNSDKDLTFASGTMGYSCNSVNGYMISDGYLNADVAAGKKANESIRFGTKELGIYGITEIADIQIGFSVSDDDYNRIYSGPRQIKTSIADSYDYETDTYIQCINSGVWEAAYDCTIDYYAENELYNQGGIRILSETLMTNKDGEKSILLEVENNSSESVYGAIADISVNGLVFYDGTWTRDAINPGTRCVMDFSPASMLDETYWDAFGISDVGVVVFSFTVEDSELNDMITPQEMSITIPGVTASFDDSGVELYNENGIRFIYKGMFDDSFEYSNDIHMLLLVENNYSEEIRIDDVHDSLSLNGFMTDFIAYRKSLHVGKYAVIDVKMRDTSLEKNGITKIEDITEVEIGFEIKDNHYKTIDEVKLSIQN